MTSSDWSGTRRSLLAGAVAAGSMTAFGAATAHFWPAPKPLSRKANIKVAYLPLAACVAPVTVAAERGFFASYNLDAQIVPFGFPTGDMLRSPVIGQTDAAVAMIQNFLLPLQEGWPLKLITPIHGGCVRILGSRAAGVTDVTALRGKSLGVPAGPVAELARMVFKVLLIENGVDPSEVTFVPVEKEDYAPALKSGRIQACSSIDPLAANLLRDMPDLVEVASNMRGPMAGRACCVVAAGPRLWRDRPEISLALTGALAAASDWTMRHPEEAAGLVSKGSPFREDDIVRTLKEMNYQAHAMSNLNEDVQMFARDLKRIGVFPPGLDPKAFADRNVAQNIC